MSNLTPGRTVAAALLAAIAAGLGAAGPPHEAGRFRAPELVELTRLDPAIHLDVRYARSDNFLGLPVYDEARAFLQRPAAEALVRVHRALREQGFGIVVFDGYRPWSVTKRFWDATPPDQRIFVADPATGSNHNRGCAVDLSLYDLATGDEVAMPGEYDEMSQRSYTTYEGGTPEARARRDLLRGAMEREGFFVYPWEWWHFDYKDRLDYAILDLPFSAIAFEAPRPAPLDLGTVSVIDLSHAYDATTLYWPTSPAAFEIETLAEGDTPGGYFYSAKSFCTPEHGGTHLDAPLHFARGAWSADAIPVERFVTAAYVLDVADRAGADPDYRLTAADVGRWEDEHGRIPRGSVVLLRTGWGARWPDRLAYFGDDTPHDASQLHFPSFGAGAARLLIEERGAVGIGVDTPSIDHGPSRDFPVHRIVAAAGVYGLENLAALERLPATGFWLAALPMKIGRGTGAPVRAVALVDGFVALEAGP